MTKDIITENFIIKAIKKVPTQRWVAVGILFVLVLVISIANPLFLRWNNIIGITQQVAAMGIIALGAMVVIITGGIDLSSGNGLAMAGVLAGVLYLRTGENIAVLILGAIVGGLVLGIINGFLITKSNLKPFVATLATMALAQRLAAGLIALQAGHLDLLAHGGRDPGDHDAERGDDPQHGDQRHAGTWPPRSPASHGALPPEGATPRLGGGLAAGWPLPSPQPSPACGRGGRSAPVFAPSPLWGEGWGEGPAPATTLALLLMFCALNGATRKPMLA